MGIIKKSGAIIVTTVGLIIISRFYHDYDEGSINFVKKKWSHHRNHGRIDHFVSDLIMVTMKAPFFQTIGAIIVTTVRLIILFQI